MLVELFVYVLGGAAAGVAAGLFGVGGGIVMVPVLLFLFARVGMPEAQLMHMAVATSLAVIVPNALSSVRAHHRRGAVSWPLFRRLTPGVVVGALAGALLADRLASDVLVLIFALFLLGVSIKMLLAGEAQPQGRLPGRLSLNGVGAAIGAFSALVGIGGGTLTVPFLVRCNVAVKKAVATSSAVGLPIALAGAVGFIVAGWSVTALPPWSLGYVYLPAFVGMAVAGALCAPLGARLAHALPGGRLKQAFGVLLLLVSLRLLYGLL